MSHIGAHVLNLQDADDSFDGNEWLSDITLINQKVSAAPITPASTIKKENLSWDLLQKTRAAEILRKSHQAFISDVAIR